jgi:hypothetical protein
MRSLCLRTGAIPLTGVLLVLATAGSAEACGWWCDRHAAPHRGAQRVYGYNAYIPTRPRARVSSRAVLLTTPPPPGGNTTLDPPTLVTTQGVLESPVPGLGPGLLGSSRTAYGYTAAGSARWWRRPRR